MHGAPVRLLWTGGWDSTFRLLQLCLVEGRRVQPIYVIDPDRPSTRTELLAMRRIRERIVERGAGDLVSPTEVHVRSDYEVPDTVNEAFARVAARVTVGSQYIWLAAVAIANGWQDVEIGMHRWESERPFTDLAFSGQVCAHPTIADPDVRLLLSPWSFPLLSLSKRDMAAIAEREGFLDILSLRWFCHRPIAGRPCGFCVPCVDARQERAATGFTFFSEPVILVLRGCRFMLHRYRRSRTFAGRVRQKLSDATGSAP